MSPWQSDTHSDRPFDPLLVAVGNASPVTGSGNNTYLVAPDDGPACLIDAGVGGAVHLDAIAAHLGARRSTLADVLVTHAHLDHASGAPAVAQRFGDAAFRKYVWSAHDVAGVTWQHVADGARLHVGGCELLAIHTPGHAPDHLAFWHEASGTVFSGDLVHLHTSVAIIFSRGGDLGQYLASLERLLALAPTRLLPGHGGAIDDPAAVLRATLAHRSEREAQVVAALRSGRQTVQTIADSIYHGLGPALMALALENVRAHLEKLKREGRAAGEAERWWLA